MELDSQSLRLGQSLASPSGISATYHSAEHGAHVHDLADIPRTDVLIELCDIGFSILALTEPGRRRSCLSL
jgi:hypothetical protein